MKTAYWSQVLLVVGLFMPLGCSEVTPPISQEIHSRSIPSSLPQRIEDLAGSWEYKDAAGEGIITLNAEGKGIYEWEEGRFETLSLDNRTWTGLWVQKGNDREGGFKLTFTDEASTAQGEWWYTRIGEDSDPLQPGGTFRMSRRSSTLPISAE